jgi:Cu(I)/Ag(I) efflux system membrane fusion protein
MAFNNLEKKIFKYVALLMLSFAAGAGIWTARTYWSPTGSVHEHPGQVASLPGEEQSQVWTCSMHPQIRLPNPGQCPICAMDLIPVKEEAGHGAGEARSLREIRLSPYAERLAEIQTHPVERKHVRATLRMVGRIDYDETRVANIAAWVPGRLERLFVDFTGTRVTKGDPMVSLYSPELLSTQSELLLAVRARERAGQSTLMQGTMQGAVDAARERLRLWGLAPQQITEIIQRGKPSERMTLTAPMSGVVVRKDALEGMYVRTGDRIYTIADLSRVWVRLEAYESDMQWIRKDQDVEFQAEAYPGELFRGTVDFIDPFLNPDTRTVRVRLNAPNPDGRLKPEMLVHAMLRPTPAETGDVVTPAMAAGTPPLVIPATAPLVTGRRAVVYVAVPDAPGTYEGREVVLGPRAADHYLVRRGLAEGEMVVVHGSFKIDSAIQILAKPSMMTPEGGGGGMEHQHGPAAQPAGAAAAAATAIPVTFRQQIDAALSSYEKISQSVQAEDLGRARKEFSSLGKALQMVDATPLSGHARMVWLEFAMLLGNDAVVGSESRSLWEANRTLQVLQGHVDRIQRELGLGQTAHAATAAEPLEPIPTAFQARVARVLDAYLAVHEDLAADRFDEAQEGMKSLEKAIRAVDMAALKGRAHKVWLEHLSEFNEQLKAAGDSRDMASLRAVFLPISRTMTVVVESFGIEPGQPVYEIRCPMAFDGKGGNWLQKDKDVRNPYYGAMMFRCGDVVRTLHRGSGPAGEGG